MGLFSGELIFGGAYIYDCREFCVSKSVRLSLTIKQIALTVHGLIFGRAYYWKDFCVLVLGGLFSRGLIFFWGGGG